MAYAALVSLGQTIVEISNHDQYSISLDEKQQIISIHEYIIFLQAFLEDFPERANSLEERIRDVAYEAEDIIEYRMLEQIGRQRSGLLMRLRRKKSDLYSKLRQNKNELKKVTEEIDSIAREVMKIKSSFRIKEVEFNDFPIASSSSRLAPIGKDDTVGFHDDLMAIMVRLCGESSKLQVIPIIGMGGIGKTTLARNAYDDPLTVEHFQIRAWVTVSQDYNEEEILSNLLVSMKSESFEQSYESKMAENVYKSLKGRRYLIIMDDLWCTKAWDDVRMIFPDDNNGSRIILTTRVSDVAAYPDSSSPLHEMRFMDVDQSWSLFRQKVFCPPELENIGKEIARSCRGLPLAIVVIAGLLSTVSKTRASWENIARNVSLAVSTANDEQFAKIVLSSSYNHLPHYLRPCFLYMGSFPEDYEIHVSKLIKLWVAEGFLKLPNGCKSYEKEAEEYLEDLVKRSLILVTRRKSNGKIKCCSVHDLVRDLCIRKAHQVKFHLNVMDRYASRVHDGSISNARRISIAHLHLHCLKNIYGSSIHTIICLTRRSCSWGFLRNFRLLRVLHVVNANVNPFSIPVIMSLPAEIFELLHLRYLAFDYPVKIPAAISNLQNLQTLIIHPRKASRSYLPCMVFLSPEVWRLPQLRHLVSSSFSLLLDSEGATFALENLQTLSVVTNFICSERIIKMIPNLKKLGISYSGYEYVQDFHLCNLAHLHQLEILTLRIYPGFPFWQKLNPIFPRMLRKLSLSGTRLPWKEMGRAGLLPNLEVLKLRNYACTGDKWETSEGEFCQLKFLLIDGSYLSEWITESSHFPSLKFLMLYHCLNLSEIPDGIGEVLTLEWIEVDDGNRSLFDSAKRIQEEQQNWGNDTLQIRSVHYDIWTGDIE